MSDKQSNIFRFRSHTAPSLGGPSDRRLEPPACRNPFSTVAGGQHYFWRGAGSHGSTIAVYYPYTETWEVRPTTGSSHPIDLNTGGCTAMGDDKLYTFGGFNGSTRFNDFWELDLECDQWTKIHPTEDSAEWPLRKEGCGLVSVDEGSLGCFGGFGDDRWTNEFHIFSLNQGAWSKTDLKGQPPCCSHFSFTKIDGHRAVLFGGFQPGYGKVNDVYLFNFSNMEVTKVEPVQGEPWPDRRERHAACCLNYGKDHPVLLVHGGEGNSEGERKKLLGDMWMLDIDAGKWTKVKSPKLKPMKPQYNHSITASSLAPGLTEALMFGGQLEWFGDPVAETTIFRFELTASSSSVAGPSTGRWSLVDVARNSIRCFPQRMREKKTAITEANNRSPPVSKSGDQSLKDQVMALQKKVRAAEQRVRDAERRAEEALRQKQATQHRLQESQRQMEEAHLHCQDAERKMQELTAENGPLLQKDPERRVNSLEAQWVIHHWEIQMTERGLGEGGWGIVKVAKFRGAEVAAKTLHKQLQSYYRGQFICEMNMAARLRHPNLVQFIGATLDIEMIILMELMHTSLRRVLDRGRISSENTVSISTQVCQALNYLHLTQPDPVIHRDISSRNVLLNPLPNSCWRAKVADYGTVKDLQQVQTANPGTLVYAAPEANKPSLQSTKMDIFSLGVLLIEMCSGELPIIDRRDHLLNTIQRQDHQLSGIINRCIDREKDNRPTASELLNELV